MSTAKRPCIHCDNDPGALFCNLCLKAPNAPHPAPPSAALRFVEACENYRDVFHAFTKAEDARQDANTARCDARESAAIESGIDGDSFAAGYRAAQAEMQQNTVEKLFGLSVAELRNQLDGGVHLGESFNRLQEFVQQQRIGLAGDNIVDVIIAHCKQLATPHPRPALTDAAVEQLLDAINLRATMYGPPSEWGVPFLANKEITADFQRIVRDWLTKHNQLVVGGRDARELSDDECVSVWVKAHHAWDRKSNPTAPPRDWPPRAEREGIVFIMRTVVSLLRAPEGR